MGLGFTAQAQYVEGDSVTSKDKVAATQNQGSFFNRLNFGGNFGAAFGSSTYLNLSPTVTYRFTDRLWAGPGVTYIYQAFSAYGKKYTFNTYGARFVGRYQVFEQFLIMGEVESLNLPAVFINPSTQEITERRMWYTSPLFGAGYMVPLGRTGSGFFLSALYNFNYRNSYGLYGSPWVIRVGFAL